jgi:hypothetical protein
MEYIRRQSSRIDAKHILFILDACYGGIAGYQARGDLSEQTKQFVKSLISKRGRQIMTAGGANEIAREGDQWDRHGVYTYFLLKGLREEEADYNQDKVVTVYELQTYLLDKVTRDAPNQTPQLRFLDEGHFVFYREGDL